MLTTILQLPDGSRITSGQPGRTAIRKLTLTESVNEGQELTVGSVCANMLELTLILGEDAPRLCAGEELKVFRREGEKEVLFGTFLLEKPQKLTDNTLKLLAYDRVSLLDRDITAFLESLSQWPYSLGDLVYRVCSHCGASLAEGEVPNWDFPVAKFTPQGITARQLVRWAAQIAGCFCRATPEGLLEFAWYAPFARETPLTVLENGAQVADYRVAPIEKVCLQPQPGAVGTVYPQEPGEGNTYFLTGNPFLTAASLTAQQAVAQFLYGRLRELSYTPMSLSVFADGQLRPGQILEVTRGGQVYQLLVMRRVQSGQRDRIECTGSPGRDYSAVTNDRSFRLLEGKVLKLSTDVEGIRAEHTAANGDAARLALTVEGISTEVSAQQTELGNLRQNVTQLRQTADGVQVQVESILTQGVSKVKNALGLSIDGTAVTITRADTGMTNALDEKGMSVIRGKGTDYETVMLRADAAGVVATDVTVRNYLRLGDHARLEDYVDTSGEPRTACFYI